MIFRMYFSRLVVVKVGFVDTSTLVEVNETDGTAALNVSISFPTSNVTLGFEIILLVNTVDGSASTWYSYILVFLSYTCS